MGYFLANDIATACFGTSKISVISTTVLFFSFAQFDISNMAQQIERNQEATVYIGNLDERCTESLIWELMLQAGPVGNDYLLLPTNSSLIFYKY